jgi:hypothetical protein
VGSGRWSWVSFFAVWAFGRRAGAGQGPYFLRIFTSPLASACPPRSSSRRPGPGPNSAARGEEVGGEGRRSTAVLLGRPAPPAAPCPLEARWGQLPRSPDDSPITYSLTHSLSLTYYQPLDSRLSTLDSREQSRAEQSKRLRACSMSDMPLAAPSAPASSQPRATHTHTHAHRLVMSATTGSSGSGSGGGSGGDSLQRTPATHSSLLESATDSKAVPGPEQLHTGCVTHSLTHSLVTPQSVACRVCVVILSSLCCTRSHSLPDACTANMSRTWWRAAACCSTTSR